MRASRLVQATSSTDPDVLAIVARARPPWMRDALCREPEERANFFPELGESTAPAKAVCARCLVREECLAFALAEGITAGIWGGLSAKERRRARARRREPG